MLLKHYVTEACAILITLMRLSPSINSPMYGDFPGGPVVRGVWVQFLVRELRSHMPHGQKTKT